MVNQPMIGTVPMKSALLFASVSLAAMTYLVVRLPGRWRLAAGPLAPLSMVIAGAPANVFLAGQAWVLGAELALIWGFGVWYVVTAQGLPDVSTFAQVYPACYLGVMAVFWLTTSGVPVVSVVYAVACFAGAGLVLARLYRTRVLV
jgi:hypothetical protein